MTIHRDHLPFKETGPLTATVPGPGETCQICGLEPEWQSDGTVEIGMFVADLDERVVWSEGKRLPATRLEANWTDSVTNGRLIVCTGPTPHHMPNLFAHFPLENGLWANLLIHPEEPSMTLEADSDLGLHIVWGPDGKTPIANPDCEGFSGQCHCLPFFHGSNRRSLAGCMVTVEVIDTDDITDALSLWGSLSIPNLKEALERGRRVEQEWLKEHGRGV